MVAGALVLVLVSAITVRGARADTCRVVDRDTADRAVALLGQASKVLDDDWFDPATVSTVAWRRRGFRYEVVVNGSRALDLSATYLSGPDGGDYRNLGSLVGCPPGEWPERISPTPFVAARDAIGPGTPAAAGDDSQPEAVVGILELPELEAAWYNPGRGPVPPVPVYEEPAAGATRLATIARLEQLPLLEYGYEQRGPIVVERRPDWYRIELANGRGWIAAADAGRFHPVAELLRARLTYLTPVWSGRLWSEPSADAEARDVAPAWRRRLGDEIPIEVLESKRVDERLWLKVALLWPSPCAGPAEPRIVARGWLPAHGATGAPNVWFYSRGC